MWNGFSLLFFPFLHHIHSFHSKPWPWIALPPAHSPHAPLTHLMLLYLNQTQLSYLTSFHPSICPSSFLCIFSHCPHYYPLYPNNSLSSSISLFLFLTQSFHLSLDPSIPFFFLIHIHVISVWQPGAAVRDCYFVLKVLKACLIYSNNLGYIQKCHYRSMCAHTLTQTHTELFPTSYRYLLSSILLAIFNVLLRLSCCNNQPFNREKIWLLIESQRTMCGLSACVCVWLCVFFGVYPFPLRLACLKLWGKWEMWILKSHQFTQQRGRIDWICSELQ